jgi:hypothetical protein
MNTASLHHLEEHLPAIAKCWENLLVDLQIKSGRVCALQRLMFTWALLADVSLYGYEDRWCYDSYEQAKAALDAWSGDDGSEPSGWKRHPDTGRRRDPDGTEYVMP